MAQANKFLHSITNVHLINDTRTTYWTLLSIIRFRGQGFVKVARSAAVMQSFHIGLGQRLGSAGIAIPDPSYLDVPIELLLRYVYSEPKPSLREAMQTFNVVTQATAIDVLHALVARGDMDIITIETVDAVQLESCPRVYTQDNSTCKTSCYISCTL